MRPATVVHFRGAPSRTLRLHAGHEAPPLVPGVPDRAARIALELLAEAPTLAPCELSAWLGITERQAALCIAQSRRLACARW